MTRKKISDKFKIILAVAAVVAVASAAIVYAALSTNGVVTQDNLNAGISTQSDSGLILTTGDGISWSTDSANPATVGYYAEDKEFESTFSGNLVNDIDWNDEPTVTGLAPDGTEITSGYWFWGDINTLYISDAGTYTVTVTLNDGNTVTFYAQILIRKTQLSTPVIEADSSVYTGNTVSSTATVKEVSFYAFDNVFTMTVTGVDSENEAINNIKTGAETLDKFSQGFDVVDAGTYTVTLTIKDEAADQYEWAADASNTATFTLAPAEVSSVHSPGKEAVSIADVSYTDNMTVQSLKNAVGLLECSNDSRVVGCVNVELYSDSACKVPLKDSDIKAGTAVHVKVRSSMVAAREGDKTYRNYYLPSKFTSAKIASFKITVQTINAPDFRKNDSGYLYYYDSVSEPKFPTNDYKPRPVEDNTINAFYLNYGYKIFHWFDQDVWNSTDVTTGYNKGAHWKVTVNDTVISDLEQFEMKEVGKYTVKITPSSDSYSFGGGKEEFVFYFNINKYRLMPENFGWKDNHRVYTGNGIEFGAEDCPVVNLPNPDHKVTAVLEWTNKGGLTDEFPIAVGKEYTYKVIRIEGADAEKYYDMPTSEPTNVGHEFKIYRSMLPDFSAFGPIATGTYNGKEQKISVEEKYKELGLIVEKKGDSTQQTILVSNSFEATVVLPNGESKTYPITLGPVTSDDPESYFVFTHAGSYSIKITADKCAVLWNNYCWYGASDEPDASFGEHVWENFAIVSSAQIDPSLDKTNISANDDYVDLAKLFAQKFSGITVSEGKSAYSLLYGNGKTTSPNPLDKDASGKYLEGEYTLAVTLNDEFYPDVEFKAPQGDEYTLSDDKKTATMSYSVNSNSAKIEFTVKDSYTFGDNFDSAFRVVTVVTQPVEGVTYGETTITYLDKDKNSVAADNLVNGSPRNAGKYFVLIQVAYTTTVNGEIEAKIWERERELTVNPRAASLSWTVDDVAAETSKSFDYDGTQHTVAVENATIAGVPNVTVSISNASNTNAGTYVITASLSGAEADNYTLEGVANTTFTLTITRAEITVTAKEVASIIFGEALTLDSPAYTVTGLERFTTEHGASLSVAVYGKDGSLVSTASYASLARGTYTVVPVYGTADESIPALSEGKYVKQLDNYNVTMVVKTFSVTSKALVVTLYNGASSQYGDEVNLYVPRSDGKGVYSTNISMTVEEFKQLVEITATLNRDGTNYNATDAKAPVGTYALSAKPKIDDGDYSITTQYANADGSEASSATYEITRREITIKVKDVLDHPFGTTYFLYNDESTGYKYNDYEITSGRLLDGDEAALKIDYAVYRIKNKGTFYEVTKALEDNGNDIDEHYCHVITTENNKNLNSKFTIDDEWNCSYVLNEGNYKITVNAGKFVMVPREIELTFASDAAATYGDAINFWQQETGLSGASVYSKYLYCAATNLRFAPRDEITHADDLKDVIELTLVKSDGSAFDKNAGTYKFKATVKHNGYVIKNGQNDGKEIVGGKLVVNPKDVTVTTTASASSIIYGNGLNGVTLGFTVNGLVDGDTKESLGINVGIYKGENNVTSTISAQDAGTDYCVDVSPCTNGNYNVTEVTKQSFTINKRPVTVTANSVTGHVYGEAYSGNLTFTVAPKTDVSGFVDDAHCTALGIVAALGGSADKLSVGSHDITLTKENDNPNYAVTLVNGSFQVVARKITITAQAAQHIYGDVLGASELAGKYTVTTTNGTGSAIVNGDNLSIALKVYDGEKDVTDSVNTLATDKTYAIKPVYDTTKTNYIVTVENAALTVTPRSVTITFKAGASSVYGEAVSLSSAYEIDGGLLERDLSAVTVTATNAGGTEASSCAPVGSYAVSVTINSNYNITYKNADSNNCGAYQIAKRAVKLVANDATHTYGESYNVSGLSYFVASGDGLYAVVNGDNLDVTCAVVNGESAVTDFAALNVKTGGYEIRLSKGASSNANYDVTLVSGTFTVTPRVLTVTYVEATKPAGSPSECHSVYYADKTTPNIVDETLYSSKVVKLASGDLVNGATLRSVLKLTATLHKNGKTHNATDTHAPAGNYTITPEVIDANYVLKEDTGTGVYVIGKAGLAYNGASGTLVAGTFGYTGEAQSVCSKPIIFDSVDGSAVTVLYKIVPKADKPANLDESFFDTGATTEMPTVTDVSENYICCCVKAENHNTATMGVTFNIVPATLTVTAKDVALTYGDSLSLADAWYDYTAMSAVSNYAGLSASTLKQYLDKITHTTNYVTTTAAEASNITVSPVYDNGSLGDDNVKVVCVSGSVTVRKASITNVAASSGYNGVYTGQARNLFADMTATTRNSQAVTWYYRESGQTDSDWTQYNNNTLIDVCRKTYQVKATAANHVDAVYETDVLFEITQNSLSISIDDKSITYGGKLSDLIFTATCGSNNGILSSLVEGYKNNVLNIISVSYDVTTSAGSVLDITSNYVGDANVEVTVTKGSLTVNKRTLKITFVNGLTGVYGDSLASDVLDTLREVEGELVNGDTLTVTAENGAHNLTDVNAPAGTYTVKVTASNNYALSFANGESGSYVITKRVITPTLKQSQVVYTEDGDDYHNGIYGAEHNAIVIFDNLAQGDELSVNSGYTMMYGTQTVGDWQVAGDAPRSAGKYSVAVTLKNPNYIFVNDKSEQTDMLMLSFEVLKKTIDASAIDWNDEAMEFVEGQIQTNVVNGYVNAIMNVVSVVKTTAEQKNKGEHSVLPQGDASAANSYYFDENGLLCIAAQGRAEYKAEISLNSDAANNYKFVNLLPNSENVEATFYIISEIITLTVNSAGWRYLDIVREEAVNAKINSEDITTGLSYEYVRINDNVDLTELLERKAAAGYGGFDLKDVNGLYNTDDVRSISFSKMNGSEFDVGRYIIIVTYDFLSAGEVYQTTKYDIITILPKLLNIPTELKSKPFSGEMQGQDIVFTMSNGENIKELVSVTTNEGTDRIRIIGYDAGTYKAQISIKDAIHYVWDDSMNADGGTITVTWQITKDTADNAEGKYFTVGAIADTVYGEAIAKTDPLAKSGYGSAYTWYFASKGSLTDASAVTNWKEWNETNKPTNAGKYFVKVVLTDTSDGKVNFTDKTGYSELSISKATLRVTLSGSLTYGNKFSSNYCSYSVVESDLINGDTSAVVRKTSGVTYYLVDDNNKPLSNTSKLEVDNYKLTALTENKLVSGLEADNYNITLAEGYGVFTITPKSITVTIGNASGQYGLTPDLSGVTVTYTDSVDNEIVIAGVKTALVTDATKASPVRAESYAIDSTYENKNFTITFVKGGYTVTPRVVTVTLDNSNAGGTFGSEINGVQFSVNDDGKGLAELVSDEFTLTVVYNGTANNGTVFTDSEQMPAYAGAYKATVRGADNANFSLTIPNEVDFVVIKAVLDSSKITAKTVMYTGSPLAPEIIDNDYNVQGTTLYAVSYADDMEDAKVYKVTLTLIDGYNYAWNAADNDEANVLIDFEIAGAGIYAIPYGSIIYGQSANGELHYRLVYASGDNAGLDASSDVEVSEEEIVFMFVDKDELSLNLDKLSAGSYRLTLKTENGFVVGFKSNNPNYANIALKLDEHNNIKYGEFVVTPRAITLKPHASTSIYSQDVVISQDFDVVGELQFNDGKDKINYRAFTEANNMSNAGDYAISATANNANYEITIDDTVKHVILPVEFDVTLSASNGIYNDGNVVASVGVESLTSTNLEGYSFPSGFEALLSVKVSGTQNNGVHYSDANGAIPQNAGDYTATVTACSDKNYKLNNVTEATFTVSKKVIDQSVIKIDSKPYNGYKQSHGLANGEGYTVSAETYKDAGSYDVALTLTNEFNYAWNAVDNAVKTVAVPFEITKTELVIRPYGSDVYGNGFSQRACGHTFTGFKGSDNESVVSGSAAYSLVGDFDKLTVRQGGYELAAHVENMSAANYDIVVKNGTFTVVKRVLSITPTPSTSVYTQRVVLSDTFELMLGSSFVYGDDASVISFGNARTTATDKSPIGVYPVMASATADNYDVQVTNGTHTIERIKVGVDMRVTDGVYGEKAGEVKYMSVIATNLNGTPAVEGLQFTLKYSGKTNGGNTINSSSMPQIAGLYKVVITDVDDSNYVIDRSYGVNETWFEIAKKAIDVSKITAKSATYRGTPIRPEIIDESNDELPYYVNYGSDYPQGFVDVGIYDLTLRLTDTDNYCWLNNLNPYATIKFEVTRANNAVVDDNGNVTPSAKIEISDWTVDETASKPTVKLLNGNEGNITFEYSNGENGVYTTEVPTVAGAYWVRVSVAQSGNYNAFTSKPVSFVIKKRVVAMPTVISGGSSVYSGETLSLEISNYDDKVMSLTCDLFTKNANGVLTLSALNAGTYTARLKLRDSASYEWADASKLVDDAVVISWTIERKILTKLSDATNKFVVNGEDIVFTPEGFNSGIMTIEGNVRAHQGNYSAVITLKDTVNYAWEGTDSNSITVNFELTGTNTAFVAAICVVAGLCVGLAVMAVILTVVNRRKKRKQAQDIDQRSRADGWEE